MSFVGKETEDAPKLRRQSDELLRTLVKEIKLLNVRFEEAFRTNITHGDVSDED